MKTDKMYKPCNMRQIVRSAYYTFMVAVETLREEVIVVNQM